MKIDTSAIQGFDGMTADQKLAAVLGMDIPEPDMAGWVRKDVFDAKATEAANLNKQLRARMSDEEVAKAAEAAKYQDLEAKYNELLKANQVSDYKAKYLAMGYDENLATDTAQAMADGNIEKVFSNGEKFKSELEKRIKADILKNTPRPGTDGGAKGMTKEEIMQIRDASERQAAIKENIELFIRKED